MTKKIIMTDATKRLLLYSLAGDISDMVISQTPNMDHTYAKAFACLSETCYDIIRRSGIYATESMLKKIRASVDYLYKNKETFDVVEVLSIIHLGCSDIIAKTINKNADKAPLILPDHMLKRATAKCTAEIAIVELVLWIIKLYDPDYLEQDKYKNSYNRYLEWISVNS